MRCWYGTEGKRIAMFYDLWEVGIYKCMFWAKSITLSKL